MVSSRLTVQNRTIESTTPSGPAEGDWNDTEFEPFEDNPAINPKLEEALKKREERKLMRQKEMGVRKQSKGGPMKLGAKKL